MFVYWIIGTFNNDIETLTLTVGIVRSFESLGSAVAFGIGAAKGVTPMTNLIVAFVMFIICIPTTSLVVFMVPEHPKEKEELIEDTESERNVKGAEEPELAPVANVASRTVVAEERVGKTL
jgi:hypothetical protein